MFATAAAAAPPSQCFGGYFSIKFDVLGSVCVALHDRSNCAEIAAPVPQIG